MIKKQRKLLGFIASLAGLETPCVIYSLLQGGENMADFSLEQLFRGEKYDIMSEVGKDLMINGVNPDYDAQTWFEMLHIKHTIIAISKMIKEGDSISDIPEFESLSSCKEVKSDESA